MRKKTPVVRVRRTADDARAAILDATQRRLAEVGPAGIRLQDVAAEVGVAHPTVLHHFGSREALVQAVVERSIGGLERDLMTEMAKSPEDVESVAALLDCVARVLGPGGHARVVAWLALEGHEHAGPTGFDTIARAAHEIRKARWAERGQEPPFEDTYFAVLLTGLALFGDAIAGPLFRGQTDPREAEATGARFRLWLAALLRRHLEEGMTPPPRPSSK